MFTPTMKTPRTSKHRAMARMFGLAFLSAIFATFFATAPARAWWNDEWTLRKKITIDTSATGVPITDMAGAPAPVLVRLHAGNFRFAAAREDGSDLRFIAGDDKTPLKFQVEKFNPLLNEALVWVNVPDLKPGAHTEFWLYYNNHKAPGASDAKGVYDSDTVLDYHFAESGSPAADSSIWANNAAAPGRTADGALIGQGLRLDGTDTVGIPDSSSLNPPENAPMTWSAWINMTAPQPNAVVFSHREGGGGFAIGLDNGVPYAEVGAAGQTVRTPAAAPMPAGEWHHLTMIADGGNITLFLDGNPYASVAGAMPALTGKSLLGGDNAAASATTDQPAADASQPSAAGGFAGELDELTISKIARSPGFIRFVVANQGRDPGKLMAYSEDEETSTWFSGYFAVILKSVTLDGWVVIGVLAIMMVLSWIVMVDKIGYIGRQAKANARFMEAFHDSETEFASLEPAEPVGEAAEEAAEEAREPIKHSSLLRLYDLGVSELRRRFARRPGEHILSDQAITAIRAALDTVFIKETQKLNRLMVVLTIAISGGPFLGLLGTVVGVMITFAAIAATGDVNVNAIAPGIAAALVATVAGLAVAIPALFGYNYLTVRIKDLTSDMQVFVDELLARMAEEFQPHPNAGEPRRQAAE